MTSRLEAFRKLCQVACYKGDEYHSGSSGGGMAQRNLVNQEG